MSLRMRLFATFTLIVVLCLGLVALAVTVILQSQRDRLALERLDAMARPISVQVRSLFRGQVSAAELQTTLEEQAQKNNVFIIFGDNEGNIVRQVTPAQNRRPIEVPSGGLPHTLTQPAQGKFTASNGQTYLYAAYPLVRQTATQETARLDTLVLSMPRTGAIAVVLSLFSPFLLAGLIALILSLIIALLFARSIYQPINRVKVAAEKMAQGHYDQEIPVAGPRECQELAASFNQMAQQVKRSQQQLRHFVADVSHQLKSPLTSIHGFAQALLDGTANDEAAKQRAATIISEESRRMKKQVDQLLEIARMQAGQLRIERTPVDINELLEHCREVFTVQADEKQVKIKIAAEPLMNVPGDFDRLEQVFSNLLDNAIKNSPKDGEVRLKGRNLTNEVELSVSDDGPGIAPEQLPYLFERFHQATGVRSGYGLGLAIAREIVTAHGGTIEAKSEPGEGAQFIVRLPFERSAS
jgi:signal transduction histidine kinase